MRWLCENCGTVTDDADLLQAPSPFDPATEMTGCPKCKAHDEFRAACAVCDRPACGGRSDTESGLYQALCRHHYGQ